MIETRPNGFEPFKIEINEEDKLKLQSLSIDNILKVVESFTINPEDIQKIQTDFLKVPIPLNVKFNLINNNEINELNKLKQNELQPVPGTTTFCGSYFFLFLFGLFILGIFFWIFLKLRTINF